jgi:phosphatidylserine/phosphatidylglycerophosphate/cardiolipin synthase-like enzyme
MKCLSNQPSGRRPGRLLPEELRPERVGRLAKELTEGVRDVEFERLVHRIDTGSVHRGNQVAVFFNGEEAFASVINAIASATYEILLETYIFKDDALGHELIEQLAKAAALPQFNWCRARSKARRSSVDCGSLSVRRSIRQRRRATLAACQWFEHGRAGESMFEVPTPITPESVHNPVHKCLVKSF